MSFISISKSEFDGIPNSLNVCNSKLGVLRSSRRKKNKGKISTSLSLNSLNMG